MGAAAGALVLVLVLALGGYGLAHRQYDKFVHNNTGVHATQTRERLSDVTNNGRLPLWEAAVHIYDTQKLHGTGAGTYQLYYPRYRSEQLYVVDAHSLYLQSLAELGIVGFALILVVVFGILGGLAARIRGPGRGLYAALFAMTLAWAVHQAFDWDWQMPAVTLGVFILAGLGASAPAGRQGRAQRPASPRARSSRSAGSCSPSRRCWSALPTRACTAAAQELDRRRLHRAPSTRRCRRCRYRPGARRHM